jgi:hypothetical protein
MIASVSAWVLTAVLAQTAPQAPEAAWLKLVPSDAGAVARARSLSAAREDFFAMLKAMSPESAARIGADADSVVSDLTQRFGKEAAEGPVLVVVRLPEPNAAAGGPPPIAAFVKGGDYAAIQKGAVGPKGDAAAKPQPGGYDKLKGEDGQPVYTFKGQGFVVMSNDEGLIKAVVKPQATLDKSLPADQQARLFAGDVGIYVNLAAIQKNYGAQIDQFRQMLPDLVGQAAGPGDAQASGTINAVSGKLADAFKNAQGLVFNLDFAGEGLNLAGALTVKPDSPAARKLAATKPQAGELLARLPADAATFLDVSVDPEAFEGLQMLGLSMLGATPGAPSPALKEAMNQQKAAGPREAAVANLAGAKGLRTTKVMTFADPRKAAGAIAAMIQALGSNKSGFVKDVKIEKVQPYKGFDLAQAKVTIDKAKLEKSRPGGAGESPLGAMIPDSTTTWFGTDGKLVVSITAPSWDEAKAQIDVVSSGQGGLGQSAGYKALRGQFPDKAGALFLMNSQGLVSQVSSRLSASAAGGPKPAANGKAPAFLGGAVTPSAAGYQFKLAVPSAVGPVLQEGLGPALQGAQGR